ncbi:long-chain-fatty-acid--CoA ligase 3 isoform X2 [Sipha flava]|uniref:long-chain-fatty-acid--CoA ligase n=3 Tax=Sipha flava TaxID=143950 RepID=A0A2S2QPH5_9HEMI|nr:long-chain-fatty-acid--CoA ligase 3 isoform X2 [Sipha flava]XP_025417768.1 long-chain-fatty-acid--CoA ligase 3 isoform X2 [Sipha flava]
MENTYLLSAFKTISFIYDVITYPVYLILQQPWNKKQKSQRMKSKITVLDDNTILIKTLSTFSPNHLALVKDKIDTLYKVFQYSVNKYSESRCLGTREVLAEEDEVQPNGRIFKKYVMGDYKWMTYKDVDNASDYFGNALISLGQKHKENIAIFAETRAEWMISVQGCFKQNIPVVTLYATLGEEAIAHGINETEVSIVITSHDLLPKFKNILKLTPRVKTLIYMEDQLTKTNTSGFKDDVEIISFKSILQRGSEYTVTDRNLPIPSDIAIIMYTSGSTGVPKGVNLTHTNLIATLKAFNDAIQIDPEEDVFMGYLPLAHVFELLGELACLLCGIRIGYSTPLTMIDTSSKIKRGTKGDASILKPTVITAVPLILDRIYKGINEKVSSGTTLQKTLFKFAFEYKKKWIERGFQTPLLDTLVFKKTSALLGGRVRFILCGGAPLSPETHTLIKICVCGVVQQGYGLTETSSCGSGMSQDDMSTGRVGAPLTVNDFMLVSWEEASYRITDKPYPRGELIIGGENISPGYYKNPEKTKEEFFERDGQWWFKTGDIGQLESDGSIKIIDRKKDLVKLQGGEYVSLGKVESQLKTCPVVDNICIYGSSFHMYTIALVVPNRNHLVDMARKLNIENINELSSEELFSIKILQKAVLDELAAHGRKNKLERFEIPTAIILCIDVWTPDNNLVTAAFKLKRREIYAKYKTQIDNLYES